MARTPCSACSATHSHQTQGWGLAISALQLKWAITLLTEGVELSTGGIAQSTRGMHDTAY